MNNSASKQYAIVSQPTVPGDITSGSVSCAMGGSLGTGTLHYFTVGKLYFGLTFTAGADIYFFNDSTTIAKIAPIIAAALGISGMAAWYDLTNYGAYSFEFSSGIWNGSPPANNNRNILVGFMAS